MIGKHPTKNKNKKTIPAEFGTGVLCKSLFFGLPNILNIRIKRLNELIAKTLKSIVVIK
jgi:hypothetical protein